MRIAKNFDNFVSECPYFNGNADVNNGYGCEHKAQKEVENGQGKCYCWSCPVVILQTKKVYRKMILPGKVESRKRGVWKKIHTSFCPNK